MLGEYKQWLLKIIFPDEGEIDLNALGIDETQAELLQANFASFNFDWNSPKMSIYDNYDVAKFNV